MYMKLHYEDLDSNPCPHISQAFIFVEWLLYQGCAVINILLIKAYVLHGFGKLIKDTVDLRGSN